MGFPLHTQVRALFWDAAYLCPLVLDLCHSHYRDGLCAIISVVRSREAQGDAFKSFLNDAKVERAV